MGAVVYLESLGFEIPCSQGISRDLAVAEAACSSEGLLQDVISAGMSQQQLNLAFTIVNDRDLIELILDGGANPAYVGALGLPAVVALAGTSSPDDRAILLLLLERGANVNLRDPNGISALHMAVMEGVVGTVRLLLEWAASPNLADNEGRCLTGGRGSARCCVC